MTPKDREEVKSRATQGAMMFKDAIAAGNKLLARGLVEESLLDRRQKDSIIYHYSL